ncbi:hypothetical protein L7F22_022317 [Adiantum nelumboides]|nr:hypothetical protein [Adiantum nelumboides]
MLLSRHLAAVDLLEQTSWRAMAHLASSPGSRGAWPHLQLAACHELPWLNRTGRDRESTKPCSSCRELPWLKRIGQERERERERESPMIHIFPMLVVILFHDKFSALKGSDAADGGGREDDNGMVFVARARHPGLAEHKSFQHPINNISAGGISCDESGCMRMVGNHDQAVILAAVHEWQSGTAGMCGTELLHKVMDVQGLNASLMWLYRFRTTIHESQDGAGSYLARAAGAASRPSAWLGVRRARARAASVVPLHRCRQRQGHLRDELQRTPLRIC